jgi:hypothetical protein
MAAIVCPAGHDTLATPFSGAVAHVAPLNPSAMRWPRSSAEGPHATPRKEHKKNHLDEKVVVIVLLHFFRHRRGENASTAGSTTGSIVEEKAD